MGTIVYIDVDGVINSFGKSTKAGWQGDYKRQNVMKYPIQWYTDLVESINKLSKQEDVEFKWLTTWQNHAVEELSPALGIEGTDWEVLYCKDQDGLFDLKSWWKLANIKEDIEKHNPEKVVWIDDDIKYERNAIEWTRSLEGRVHAVSPFTHWGMTKDEFDGIIEFINA